MTVFTGALFIAIGLGSLAHAIYVYRNPEWRWRGWWSRHRTAQQFMPWFGSGWFAVVFQGTVGVAAVAFGMFRVLSA